MKVDWQDAYPIGFVDIFLRQLKMYFLFENIFLFV